MDLVGKIRHMRRHIERGMHRAWIDGVNQLLDRIDMVGCELGGGRIDLIRNMRSKAHTKVRVVCKIHDWVHSRSH